MIVRTKKAIAMLIALLSLVYDGLQLLFHMILLILSPIFSTRVKTFIKLRNPLRFLSRIKGFSQNENFKKIYWFHVSSAGEMEQAIPIARALADDHPCQFILTYYSASAEVFVKNFPGPVLATSLPWDLKFVFRKVFKHVKVDKLIFVKYDIWPHLLAAAHEKKVEVALLSALSLKNTNFAEKIKSFFYKKLYEKIDYFFCINEDKVNDLRTIFPFKKIFFAGDGKWLRAKDRVSQSYTKIHQNPALKSLQKFIDAKKKSGKKILIVGSPHKEEDEVVFKLFHHPHLCLIYVPHDISPDKIKALEKKYEYDTVKIKLLSDFTANNEVIDQSENFERTNLVIVDTIGHLAELYAFADSVIVGGGFDGYLHNTLEPAAHGKLVLIGNKLQRTPEALILARYHIALTFGSIENLFDYLQRWLDTKDDDEFEESPHVSSFHHDLSRAKTNAHQVFASLPQTSEVVLKAFLNK